MMNRQSARLGWALSQRLETEAPNRVRACRAEKDGAGERPVAPSEGRSEEKEHRQERFEQLRRHAAFPRARTIREPDTPATNRKAGAAAVQEAANPRENGADENRESRRVPEFAERYAQERGHR